MKSEQIEMICLFVFVGCVQNRISKILHFQLNLMKKSDHVNANI